MLVGDFMADVILLIRNMFTQLWGLLMSIIIPYGNVNVSFGSVVVVFLIIGFLITIFWKGARS